MVVLVTQTCALQQQIRSSMSQSVVGTFPLYTESTSKEIVEFSVESRVPYGSQLYDCSHARYILGLLVTSWRISIIPMVLPPARKPSFGPHVPKE